MRTLKELREALRDMNISAFCKKNGLPLRTVMRVKAGGVPRAGTMALIDSALGKK